MRFVSRHSPQLLSCFCLWHLQTKATQKNTYCTENETAVSGLETSWRNMPQNATAAASAFKPVVSELMMPLDAVGKELNGVYSIKTQPEVLLLIADLDS